MAVYFCKGCGKRMVKKPRALGRGFCNKCKYRAISVRRRTWVKFDCKGCGSEIICQRSSLEHNHGGFSGCCHQCNTKIQRHRCKSRLRVFCENSKCRSPEFLQNMNQLMKSKQRYCPDCRHLIVYGRPLAAHVQFDCKGCGKEIIRRRLFIERLGENFSGFCLACWTAIMGHRHKSRLRVFCENRECRRRPEFLRIPHRAASWMKPYCSKECATEAASREARRKAALFCFCGWCGQPCLAWHLKKNGRISRRARFCDTKCAGNWRGLFVRGENHASYKHGLSRDKGFKRADQLRRNRLRCELETILGLFKLKDSIQEKML